MLVIRKVFFVFPFVFFLPITVADVTEKKKRQPCRHSLRDGSSIQRAPAAMLQEPSKKKT
jgi:hypothetical protein